MPYEMPDRGSATSKQTGTGTASAFGTLHGRCIPTGLPALVLPFDFFHEIPPRWFAYMDAGMLRIQGGGS